MYQDITTYMNNRAMIALNNYVRVKIKPFKELTYYISIGPGNQFTSSKWIFDVHIWNKFHMSYMDGHYMTGSYGGVLSMLIDLDKSDLEMINDINKAMEMYALESAYDYEINDYYQI